jgi:hypothetical protein
VQNGIGLTAAVLNNTSTAENKQIKDALDALIKATLNLPAANIPYPEIRGVSDTACPGTSNPAGAVCHSVDTIFLIRYNSSSFPTPPGQAAANAVGNAINGGILACRLAQLYPSSAIKLRTGSACPETSIPPALLPTRAPVSPLTTFATLSNPFFISNSAGINADTLNTTGNQQRAELAAAYKSLLDKTIADILVPGVVVLSEVRPLTFATAACPTGLDATCQIATATFILQYDPTRVSDVGIAAGNRMQAAISAGSLICEHQRLFPSAIVVVRSGNICPTNPTAAPVILTPAPTAPIVTTTTATLTNNFVVSNPGSVSPPSQELLDAYKSLVTKRFAIFASTAGGPLKLGDIRLGTLTVVPCPTSVPVGSVCNAVAPTFLMNYTSSDFATPPAQPAVQSVQNAINSGELDCELERLYPSSVAQITTGGGCAATNPPTFDATATVSTGFFISNNAGITADTLKQAGNPQAAELAAAFNALIADFLKDLFASGAVLDGVATITTFAPEGSCPSGATCHLVSATFKLKYKTSSFPAGRVAQMALDKVQGAINAGNLICYHSKLSPSSVIKVTSGTSCPATVATPRPILSPTPAPTPSPTRAPLSIPVIPAPVLAPTNLQCPSPFVWVKPSWWKKYRQALTKKVLKKCLFFRGKVPAAGTPCAALRAGKVCMFGDATCAGQNEPETKCICQNSVWVCSAVCNTPKCPAVVPSGTCDRNINTATCEYDKRCCGDNCQPSRFCNCQPNSQGNPEWMCTVVNAAACAQTSLAEVGCPCTRPVNGDVCTSDYACGQACCGAAAFTCKCNTIAGVYQNCGRTGNVPGPSETCSCPAINRNACIWC